MKTKSKSKVICQFCETFRTIPKEDWVPGVVNGKISTVSKKCPVVSKYVDESDTICAKFTLARYIYCEYYSKGKKYTKWVPPQSCLKSFLAKIEDQCKKCKRGALIRDATLASNKTRKQIQIQKPPEIQIQKRHFIRSAITLK